MAEVHVAVGVILDAADRILLTRRAIDSHQGGLWEFPGGKVEAGESLQDGLRRELQEELGITIGGSHPLLEVRHDYGDKQVFLDVHVVRDFSGEARGLEGQPLAWVEAPQLEGFEFPVANRPIVEALIEYLALEAQPPV